QGAVLVIEVFSAAEDLLSVGGVRNADVRRQVRGQGDVLGAGNRRGAERSGYRESRSELLHVISPCKVSHWCCREVLGLGSLGSSATGLPRAGWQPGPPVLIVAVPQHAGRNASRFPYTSLFYYTHRGEAILLSQFWRRPAVASTQQPVGAFAPTQRADVLLPAASIRNSLA